MSLAPFSFVSICNVQKSQIGFNCPIYLFTKTQIKHLATHIFPHSSSPVRFALVSKFPVLIANSLLVMTSGQYYLYEKHLQGQSDIPGQMD